MRTLAIAFVLVVGTCLTFGQASLVTKYNFPLLPGTQQDTVLNGLKSIRGVWYDSDLDGNGKGEILATSYSGGGRVAAFEVVGNDSISLVWVSPAVVGDGSTPRYVTTGDLDNDGRKEIIFQVGNLGVYIYEWDGVTGSHNYGTTFSQFLSNTTLGVATPALIGNTEYFEVTDLDGNGSNELVMAMNNDSNAEDKYFIVNAVGGWDTDNPGFSSFDTTFIARRTLLAPWGLSGGSPVSMISAQLDGTGKKEMIVHNWNLKNVTILRDSLGKWAFADTAAQPTRNNLKKTNYFLGGAIDDVALFSGFAFDVDRDGRQEVYLPTYLGAGSKLNGGKVHMIHYDPPDSINIIDSSNVTTLDFASTVDSLSMFGYGYGDIDGDHNFELYFGTVYKGATQTGINVIQLEFDRNGSKTNPASWTKSVLYAGESTIYSAMTITDSLSGTGGRLDTTWTIDNSFVSKMYGRKSDFDKDGKEDIILPYQALVDSITITTKTWNVDSVKYLNTTSKIVNPKRWGLRVIEGSAITTGIEVKDLTVIMPDDYVLEQNFPNPFNPTTTIRFSLPVRDRVSLKIYDMLGREVRTLVDHQEYPAGSTQVVWDGKANGGQPVSSGTYFYSLIYGNFKKTMKMSLVK